MLSVLREDTYRSACWPTHGHFERQTKAAHGASLRDSIRKRREAVDCCRGELRRKGRSLTNWLCPPNRAYLIKRSLWKLIVKWWNTITMRVDKVGKEEVQLTHGYINVVRVDAQVGMQTIRRLLQPFTIRRFKWYCFEQDYLDQVESPNLMKQNEKCSFETVIREKN